MNKFIAKHETKQQRYSRTNQQPQRCKNHHCGRVLIQVIDGKGSHCWVCKGHVGAYGNEAA